MIVGGSSGIGLATALELTRRGERVVLVSRDEAALTAARHSCSAAGSDDVQTVAADIGVAADVQRAVGAALDRHGRIDAVVQTATTMAYGRIEDLPAEVLTRVVDTAIHGTAHLAQAVLPVFRRQRRGTLVVVNSLLGEITVPGMGAYATAKWGQLALARTLQQELRTEPDIHVCVVSPGSTNTPIYYQAANFTGRAVRPPVPVVQPHRTAACIAGLLDRPRAHVSFRVGPTNPLIVTGFRLAPAVYDRMVGPLFRLAALTRAGWRPTRGNVVTPRPAQERVYGHWPDR